MALVWIASWGAFCCGDPYLPEDSGCQSLVGQEKTYNLDQERNRLKTAKGTFHTAAQKKYTAVNKNEPDLH